MVKLNKIYTRTGDNGTTGLVSGPRRAKHDLRVDSYGDVDETNSVIGLARLHLQDRPDLDAMLFRIQNDLFDLGADLATPDTGEALMRTGPAGSPSVSSTVARTACASSAMLRAWR